MERRKIYVIKDDGSKEFLCSADMDGYEEITKDCDVQEYTSSPIMHFPTEFSFTVNMGRDQCRQFHDVISTLPIPKAKRNDKIRRSFAESIRKFGKRRKK